MNSFDLRINLPTITYLLGGTAAPYLHCVSCFEHHPTSSEGYLELQHKTKGEKSDFVAGASPLSNDPAERLSAALTGQSVGLSRWLTQQEGRQINRLLFLATLDEVVALIHRLSL